MISKSSTGRTASASRANTSRTFRLAPVRGSTPPALEPPPTVSFALQEDDALDEGPDQCGDLPQYGQVSLP